MRVMIRELAIFDQRKQYKPLFSGACIELFNKLNSLLGPYKSKGKNSPRVHWGESRQEVKEGEALKGDSVLFDEVPPNFEKSISSQVRSQHSFLNSKY